MNNPMQMLRTAKNPQAFLQNMMNDSRIMQNPVAKNTIDMMRRGDSEGLEKTARNLCKEWGINPDDALKQIKSQFGL